MSIWVAPVQAVRMLVRTGMSYTVGIGGEVAERTYAFRPFGRTILTGVFAALFWWVALDWWKLAAEHSDEADTRGYYRIKAIGLTVAACVLSIGTIGWLIRELLQ